ncbi:MAG: hypothetical protein P8Z67_10210 [Gammaproteobacteria bacterium]
MPNQPVSMDIFQPSGKTKEACKIKLKARLAERRKPRLTFSQKRQNAAADMQVKHGQLEVGIAKID